MRLWFLFPLFVVATFPGCATPSTRGAPPAPTARATATQPPRLAPNPDDPKREPHEENLFGIHVVDAYRWMERADAAPELTRWMSQEGERTRHHLDALPGHRKLRERVRELGMATAAVSGVRVVGDLLFYLKTEKGEELRKLAMRKRGGAERILVDPTSMRAANGAHLSIDHYQTSEDGKLVAYGLAEGGGEITSVHVLETETGRALPDVIERIWGEFRVNWQADGGGFFYTQMDKAAFETPSADRLQGMRVLLHRLGAPASRDVVILGRGADAGPRFEPQEFPLLRTTAGSRWVIGIGGGARAEHRVFVARSDELSAPTGRNPWTVVAEYEDQIEGVSIHGDDLFLRSSKGAPNRRVLRVPLKNPRLADATVSVAESADVIEDMASDAKALYVHVRSDGRSRLRRLPFNGASAEEIPLPFDGSINGIGTDPRREGLVLYLEGWTREGGAFALDPKSRAFQDLALAAPSGIDFSGIVAEEVEAKSADGTMVPLTIMRRKDLALDGSHPAILFGYGAYGISMAPVFRAPVLAWLERGGVYAITHTRGGGEKGDAWRLGGKGANKPKTIQDFIACGEYLVGQKYTASSRLAAYSASAGGILVGRAITERPDLFAAASIYAGIVNAFRFLEGSNGANQKAELGTPDTEAGARALLAMDAFHNVRQGVRYPAVMLATGLNDARVSPWMSAKLAAQMRWATGGERPVFLRVQGDEGHGVGSMRRQRLDLSADVWSFFLEQAGDPEFVVK